MWNPETLSNPLINSQYTKHVAVLVQTLDHMAASIFFSLPHRMAIADAGEDVMHVGEGWTIIHERWITIFSLR